MPDDERTIGDLLDAMRPPENAAIKADIAMKLDIAVAALAGVEYLGTQRRGELALMLTRVRIAIEESL